MSQTEEFIDPSSDHPRRFLGDWGDAVNEDAVEAAVAAGYDGIVKTPQIESIEVAQKRFEKTQSSSSNWKFYTG